MKNYFTDEQVKQILQKVPTSMHNNPIEEFKDLMNLAVEAAIGEPVAWVWNDEPSGDAVISTLEQVRPSDSTPLHSVKELEN